MILAYAVMLAFKDPLVDEDDPDWDRPGFGIDNKLIEDAEPYFTVLFTVRARAPLAVSADCPSSRVPAGRARL